MLSQQVPCSFNLQCSCKTKNEAPRLFRNTQNPSGWAELLPSLTVTFSQKLQLQVWTNKQKDLEDKRRECLSSMATMFPKVGLAPCDLLRGQHGQQEQGQDGAMGLWGCAWGQESRWEIREQIKASEPGRGEGRRQPE